MAVDGRRKRTRQLWSVTVGGIAISTLVLGVRGQELFWMWCY